MPVLKSTHYRSANKEAVVLDLGDLGRQAAKLRQIAEAKAEAILAAAREEAAQLTANAAAQGDERGHAEGLERGLAEGRAKGEAEARQARDEALKQLERQWRDKLDSFDAAHTAFLREARSAMLQLAVRLGEKVAHRTAETDAEVVLDQARDVLARVLEPASIDLRCCPADHAVLKDALPGLRERFANVAGVELREDEGISPGGLVLRNGSGQIDARIETQLDRLAALLIADTAEGSGRSGGDARTPDDDAATSTD